MAQAVTFEHPGVVSLWAGKKIHAAGVDLLKDLCGVPYYDLDFQELVGDENWPLLPIRELLNRLSYSHSFLTQAVRGARSLKIDKARWVLMQLNFAYDPEAIQSPISSDPVYLGTFPWHG